MSIYYKNSSSAIALALGTLLNEKVSHADEIFLRDFSSEMEDTFMKYQWKEEDKLNKLFLIIGTKMAASDKLNTEVEIEILSVDQKGKIILKTNEGSLSNDLYEAVKTHATDEHDIEKVKRAKDNNSFRVNVMSELAHIVNLTMRTMKEKISS
jgi:hypothetical protein